MANFAKTQLLKYGWTEGKGLGKNETGIVEAIKPTLKFDNAGFGHNAAEEYTYNWWESMFDKAAKNVNVNSDINGVSVSTIDEHAIHISTKKSDLEAEKNKHFLEYGNFIKTSTLHDGTLTPANDFDKSIDDKDCEKETPFARLTDEEIFKACGGRTAHKGARHGLKQSGKLSRIAEQENELLARMNVTRRNLEEKAPNKLIVKRKRSGDGPEKEMIPGDNSSEIDDNANTIQPVMLPLSQKPSTVSKHVKKKRMAQITDLTQQMNAACKIIGTPAEPSPSCSYNMDNRNIVQKKLSRWKKKKNKRKNKNKSQSNHNNNVVDKTAGEAQGCQSGLSIHSTPRECSHEMENVKGREEAESEVKKEECEPQASCSYIADEEKKIISKRKCNQEKDHTMPDSDCPVPPPTEQKVNEQHTASVGRCKKAKAKAKIIKNMKILTNELDNVLLDTSGYRAKKRYKRGTDSDNRFNLLEEYTQTLRNAQNGAPYTETFCALREASRLNSKLLKRKKYREQKKQNKRLKRLSEDLMTLNLKDNAESEGRLKSRVISESSKQLNRMAMRRTKVDMLLGALTAVNLKKDTAKS